MASPKTKKPQEQEQQTTTSTESPDPLKEREKGDVYQKVKDEEAGEIEDNPGAL